MAPQTHLLSQLPTAGCFCCLFRLYKYHSKQHSSYSSASISDIFLTKTSPRNGIAGYDYLKITNTVSYLLSI